MKDEVITALWKIKDEIGREHDYDVRRLAAMVQQKEQVRAERVVDWRGHRRPADRKTEYSAPLLPEIDSEAVVSGSKPSHIICWTKPLRGSFW